MFHKVLFLSACLVAFALLLPARSAHAADPLVANCSNDDELRTKLAAMQGAGGGGTLSNLTITKGFSTGDGGAVTVAGGGELTVEKSKFLENVTNSGSGGAKASAWFKFKIQ